MSEETFKSKELSELWAMYVKQTNIKLKNKIFCGYLKRLLKVAKRCVSLPPPISQDRNPSKLLQPSISFSTTNEALSLEEFPILVEALDHHVQLVAQHLPDPIVRHMPSESADHPVGDYPWEQAEMLGCVLWCLAGFPRNYSYLHNKNNGLLRHVILLLQECYQLVMTVASEELNRHLLIAMSHLLGFVHHVLDPDHRWKCLFIAQDGKDSPMYVKQEDIQEVPEELTQLFLSVFKDCTVPPLCPLEFSSMQLEMLHTVGAATTGLMRFAKGLVTPEVINQLLTLLHPSRSSGCGPMQALTLKVFIKVLHVLHCFMPKEEQVEVDTGVTLSKFLSVLPYRISELKTEQLQALPTFFILFLDSISLLVDAPKNSTQLKELFAEVGCFEKLVESFQEIKTAPVGSLGTTLACQLIRTLTVVMQGSVSVKASFKQHIKYSNLKQLIGSLTPPNKEVLVEVLNMALDETGNVRNASPLVYNADALGLCLEWLLEMPHSLQQWLSSKVLDLCSSSVYNKQQCCGARLTSVAVQVLMRSQEEGGFSEEIEDNLLRLIEGLGTHSIVGTELKDILVSLRPVKGGESLELPTYYFKLQYVLSALASKEKGIQSLYYFELRQPKSHIALPELVQPNQYAFSFHFWVSLDRSYSEVEQENKRRVLYSFYAGSTGFEAFFTKDLVLVVAVHSKKRGLKTVSVQEALTPQEWHSVCVVHSTSKRHSEKITIQILVDGKISATDGIRAVPLANMFTDCKIGWSHDHGDRQFCIDSPASPVQKLNRDAISPMKLDEDITSFGSVADFGGCLGPVCLFSDALTQAEVQLFHSCGPNDLSIFQIKSDEWKNKLLLYYHPKTCKDNICMDLSPLRAANGAMDGILVGEVYVTRDIKLVLSSLGGVEVFFPILEQVGLPLKQREVYSITEMSRTKANDVSTFWNTESEAIAYLFKLLGSMLTNAPLNQQVFYTVKGPATIGALLEKVPPSLLTVAAHSAIQSFVRQITLTPDQPDQQADLYSSLLFNYRIWSRADHSVQYSHSKHLSSLVSEKSGDYRRDFGVQFILDVIREYYNPSSLVNPKLSIEEKGQIRKSLMSIINLYFAERIMNDELDAILGFLSAVNDEVLLDEMLNYIFGLLTTSTHQDWLSAALWEKGLVFLVRIQAQDLDVRLTTIKLLALLNRRQGHNSTGLLYKLMHSGALSGALCQMHQLQLSSSVVLALMDLCIVKNNVNLTDYICNFVAYASTLQLLRHAPLFVRHTSCLELQSLLESNPDHAFKMAQIKGWERILLWLLTPFEENSKWQQSSAHRSHPNFRATPRSKARGEEPVQPSTENKAGQLSSSPIGASSPITPITSYSPGAVLASSPAASFTFSPGASLGNDYQLDHEKEISKLFTAVMEITELILWSTTDPMEPNGNLRRGWNQFFIMVDHFSEEHHLVVSANMIKQKLFGLLLRDVKKHCSLGAIPNSVTLQLSQLFETFIIARNPLLDAEEDFEGALVAFSHKPIFELNKDHCTFELMQLFADTLKATRILDRNAQLPEEMEVTESYLRILMACSNSNDRQYNMFCLNILQLGWLPVENVRFVFLSLAKDMEEGLKKDQSDKIGYIAVTMRCLLTIYAESLELHTFLPNLPSTVSLTFVADLIEYSKTQEWKIWLDELKVKQMQYSSVLEKWLDSLLKRTKQCKQVCSKTEAERKEEVVKDLELYENCVLEKYNTQRDNEITRQRTSDTQHKQELSATLQRWSGTRRFLTGECGAWKSSNPDLYLWKVDRTENFSRMRLKLARNYNYNKHTDASQRSSGEAPLVSNTTDTSLLAMATANKSTEEEEEHLFDHIQKLARDEPSVALEKSKKEKLMISVECLLVTVVDVITGTLDITNKCIYFVSDPQDKEYVPWYPIDFKVPLNQLREIHPRRYNMSHTAMEMFLVDRSNYYLNFSNKKTLRKVFSCILQLDTPNFIKGSLTQKPAKLVQSLGLTQKWVKREISNFDYIMQLNTISGRTYNDLNQYPIFPWILKDYTSDTLDLSNPEVFRDLSKPMGVQNPDLVERVQTKYECEDPVMGRFHYGTHYSNATTVIHYLLRLEPFTSLQIKLQSGVFDHPDRQFFSIPNAWRGTFMGSDVKELIPEFFYLPDFLRNVNGYDLGVTQDKIVVGDVLLPKWASSPEDFIRQHREALESEYVSTHLHEWIDLIFGYKQTGPEAEKAMNVFNKYSYQENVDLDNIEDEKIRRKLECMINNFGQTPTRLFNEKHPARIDLSSKVPLRTASTSGMFGGKSQSIRPIPNWKVEDLCTVSIEVATGPVVYLGTPNKQSKAILQTNETLVTVMESGAATVHGWQPLLYSSNKQPHPFVLQPDLSTSKCPCLGGPFDKDLNISSHLFALSSNNKLLLTAGHWDNSFRTYSLEKNKMIARTTHHTAVVTCMAVDRLGTEDFLITGSKDTTCVIWKFSKYDPPSQPLQTLYGHDAEVLCVDICSELDVAISGAKNGTCLVHTIRSGQLVHKLTPKKSCEIRHVAVSTSGMMVVYSVGSRSTGATSVVPCLHLYTINGRLLEEKSLNIPLNTIVVEDKWIITGSEKGFLTFMDLFSLAKQVQFNLTVPIRSIFMVRDHQSKACTHLLVGLQDGKVVILYPRDCLQVPP